MAREKWQVKPPYVDPDGYFFSADTLEELAAKIVNEYQWRPMPPAALRETVERYNSFVDSGVDADFKKPRPMYKIATPPFYAAWHTPALHDTYTGIRINTNAQVIDLRGKVIPGLYACGDSAGGFRPARHLPGRNFRPPRRISCGDDRMTRDDQGQPTDHASRPPVPRDKRGARHASHNGRGRQTDGAADCGGLKGNLL